MPLGLDDLLVAAHPVHATAEMCPVIIHHVSEKTVKKIEATIIGGVGRLKPEMPFADHTGVITGLAH